MTRLAKYTTPGGTPVWMHIRDETNDHNTLWSCLNEDEYRLPRLSGIAWDIGAYIGGVSVALAIDNPDLRIIAVEPVPENAALAATNFEQNGVADRITLIEGAVGKDDVAVVYGFRGSEAAEHHAWVGNSTLFDQATSSERAVYRGLGICDLLWYGSPALVKIDTEGAEWAFLDDPDTAKLPLIVGEWHPTGGTIGDFIALLPHHDVTFTGPQTGPGGFRAVLR